MVDSSQEYEPGGTHALQEQGSAAVHARQTPTDSSSVGQAHEQASVQASSVPETEVPPISNYVPQSDPIEARGGWPVDDAVFNTPDPVWPGMPRATFKRIGMYLRFAADRVGLRDWAFNLRWTYYDQDDEAMAAVKVVRGQKRATVFLAKDFADFPEPQQRHALIHELLHCHMDSLEQLVWSLAHSMGDAAHSVFRNNFHDQIELVVDAIASEWATTFDSIHEFDKEEG